MKQGSGSGRKRILNAQKHLSAVLKEGDKFYVGILFEDYSKSGNLLKYNLPKLFENDKVVLPLAKGAVTKANIHGRFSRKQPEEKEVKTVHIKYQRKDGTRVEFDRNFYVFVKQLVHKMGMKLAFRQNIHGQQLVLSTELIYKTDFTINQINSHVINLFCEIFNDFEIFTETMEPAINFNKRFESELLPKGTLTNKTIDAILEVSKRYSRNADHQKAFGDRLQLLMKFGPDLRGKGPNNFFGYLVFGFSELGIVLLETMYAGNATYVFKLEDYENNVIKDKQQALKSNRLIRRFFHYQNWESEITAFLKDRSGSINQ